MPNGESERQRLMDAIIARHDDDAPREAFAQWCETWDPDWSRFIRIQLRALRGLKSDDIWMGTWGDWECVKEVTHLCDQHALRWASELARWLPADKNCRRKDPLACSRGYVRGFVEYLVMTPSDLLAHGEQIKRQTPLCHLDLIGVADDGTMLELFAGPSLAGIRSLRITEHRITDEHIAVLANSPHVSALQWLVVDADALTMRGITEMAASSHLRALKRFQSNAISIADYNYSFDGIGSGPVYWDFTPECRRLTDQYGYLEWAHSSYFWRDDCLTQRVSGVFP